MQNQHFEVMVNLDVKIFPRSSYPQLGRFLQCFLRHRVLVADQPEIMRLQFTKEFAIQPTKDFRHHFAHFHQGNESP